MIQGESQNNIGAEITVDFKIGDLIVWKRFSGPASIDIVVGIETQNLLLFGGGSIYLIEKGLYIFYRKGTYVWSNDNL